MRSNQTLSVGTESNGWYEFTTTKYGMAEKWRDGTSGYKPLYIVEQPRDCYADFDSGTHTLTGSSRQWPEYYAYSTVISDGNEGDTVGRVAEIRRTALSNWVQSSITPSISGNTITVSGRYSSTATGEYEYRLKITRNGATIYTNPVRIYYNNAPVFYKYLPNEVACQSGGNVTLSVGCAGAATYTWQSSTNAETSGISWYDITDYVDTTSASCTISNITSKIYIRCVAKSANGTLAISPICTITVSSS